MTSGFMREPDPDVGNIPNFFSTDPLRSCCGEAICINNMTPLFRGVDVGIKRTQDARPAWLSGQELSYEPGCHGSMYMPGLWA